MPARKRLREELKELSAHAKYFAAAALAVVLISCVFRPIHWPSLAGGMLIGLVGFICAMVSWRWYHPWTSWLIWVVPSAAGFGVLIGWYGVSGETSMGNLFGPALWAGIVVFFGLLWLLQRRVLRWMAWRPNT
jgi:hypothetical protein